MEEILVLIIILKQHINTQSNTPVFFNEYFFNEYWEILRKGSRAGSNL